MNEKTVLVTGGCGFIGTNLINRLVEQGYRVKAPDNLSVSKARAVLGFNPRIELTDGTKQLWQVSLNKKVVSKS